MPANLPAPGVAPEAPPIPGLIWDEYRWQGTISLPTWEAFNQGTGPWKVIRAATLARRRKREKAAGQLTDHYPPSRDPLELSVSSVDAHDAPVPPSPEQVQAYHWLLTHESELLTAMLAAFERHWTDVWLVYDYDDDYPSRHSLPAKLRAPEELCGLIELHHVSLRHKHEHGMARIELAFSCDWDTEHGLGVQIRNGAVWGIGSGDFGSPFVRCQPAQ